MAVGAGARKKRRNQPEQVFQKSLVSQLRMVLERDTMVFAIPNGGYRTKAEASILVGQGVVPGMSDLMVLHQGRAFAMELKAAKGRTSDAQDKAHIALARARVPIAVIRTLPEALAFLKANGIPTRVIGGA
jgi:hypothetical protein